VGRTETSNNDFFGRRGYGKMGNKEGDGIESQNKGKKNPNGLPPGLKKRGNSDVKINVRVYE